MAGETYPSLPITPIPGPTVSQERATRFAEILLEEYADDVITPESTSTAIEFIAQTAYWVAKRLYELESAAP